MIIDISAWNGSFDFDKAKSKGVISAYMRSNFGLSIDAKYSANRSNCTLEYSGAYHYFDYRGNGADQCKKFLDTVGSWGNMRGVLDLEDNSANGWPRLDSMFGQALKEALAWVNTYKSIMGHAPVMYLNSGLARQKDYLGRYIFRNFLDCPLWIAHYTSYPQPNTGAWTEAALWQYSSTGDGLAYGNSAGNIYIDLNKVFNLQALLKPGITPEDEVPVLVEVTDAEKLARLWASHPELH